MGGAESKDSSKRDGDDPGSDLGTDCQNRSTMVSAGIAAAGLALLGAAVAGGIVALASRASDVDDRKTMKAPGRIGERIYRDEFVSDPAGYFRDLRKKDPVDAGVVALAGRSSDDRKTMKAPGRSGERIYRDEFVGDPAGYFRDLRKKDPAVDAGGGPLAGRGSDDRKTMKAPGRSDDRIFRDDFEGDPAGYFHDLRKK